MSVTDNMNDFQHTELNSIKVRNSGGGGGWVLSEFGHRMDGETALVRCVRFNRESKERIITEYSIDPRGVSKVTYEDKGPLV